MKKRFMLLALSLLSCASAAFATRHQVPQQYPTVQAAINASANSDTVLVSPGRYYENIVFRGKNITVASLYLTTGNPGYIRTTILDGSQPQHPDTASVVRLINHEDSTTVLAGFTITGGKGTIWPDAHNQPPYPVYREGGGILCEGSSPTIRDNFIYMNEAILMTGGVQSAGGGAIRADGGNPRILHNIILKNRGRYGAGIVLNYCGAIIRNNIINLNTGGQDIGGSGIWMLQNGPAYKYIENNTIVGNTSTTNGGGIFIWSTTATLRNNIIYGNMGGNNPQIHTQQGGVAVASFNLVQGGNPGPGTISGYPMFTDSTGNLLANSPAIDAGDDLAFFNDPGDPVNPALALAPAMGFVRNDMGAYGGAGSNWFAHFSQSFLSLAGSITVPGATQGAAMIVNIPFVNRGLAILTIDSVRLMASPAQFQVLNTFPEVTRPITNGTLRFTWVPDSPGAFSDTLLVYHSDTSMANPRKVKISAAVISGATEKAEHGFRLEQNAPNPFGSQTQIRYYLNSPAITTLTVTDALGREVYRRANGLQPIGGHSQVFNGNNLAAGLYHLRLLVSPEAGSAEPVSLTRKMVIAR